MEIEAMFKRVSTALLFLLITAGSLRALQPDEWIKVAPTGGGFSVMMPARPEEEVNSQKDYVGHMFTVTTANAIYSVSYGDYAPSIRLDVDDELAADRDKFVEGLNAKLLESKRITLDGRAGLEFMAENEQAKFQSRVYLFGNRVHQVGVAVFHGKDESENAKRFLSSFAFTKS